MSDVGEGAILAFVPPSMKAHMQMLDEAAAGNLERVASITELASSAPRKRYAVLLIPAAGFTSEEWWSIWAFVNGREPRPCLLVYALQSDFDMWSSILEAGGHDLIVAPFTEMKLRTALESAMEEFSRRRSA
jgi:FixJ family two-component response regulator